MAVEKWTPGTLAASYTDAFTGTNLNSIASGNAIAGNAIDNSSADDMFADLSIELGSAAFVAPNFIGVYVYPLNKDGTSYGDGRFGTSAAGPPPSSYMVGTIGLVAATQAQDGTLRGIVLPTGSFKFVLYNQGGVAFAASGNTCQYRTYNRSVA